MDKTTVKVKLVVTGDSFNPDEFTKAISISPSKTYLKGEIVRKNIVRKETCWCYSTGDEESFDINEGLCKIEEIIKSNIDKMIKFKENNDICYTIVIVIKIENGQTPAMHIEKETVELASKIGAEFDIDLYLFS